MNQYRITAIKAAKLAGKVLMKHFNKLKTSEIAFKYRHEIITKEDKKAEREILNIIHKSYPSHSTLSEEGGGKIKKSDYLWVVDPLDGTTNYSIKNPLFAVSISLFYKQDIILGVVYAPYLQELFVAEKGKGAFLNNKRIKVSKEKKVTSSLLTFCHGHKIKDIKRAVEIYQKYKLGGFDLRQLGVASLELGFVADGRTEAIMIPGAHVWDVAAGVLLVREVGGKVTDFKGREWNLHSKDMVASNGNIHTQLLKVLKKI